MAAAAILDFYFFLILTVGTCKGVNVCPRTKFRGDPSNRC